MTNGLWVLAGVVVGTLASGLINYFLQKQQFDHSREMFFLQNKSAESVKSILESMLNHRTHVGRRFVTLKRHIGGYSDDEIRHFLHELNAKKVRNSADEEVWYLLSREDEWIERRRQANS